MCMPAPNMFAMHLVWVVAEAGLQILRESKLSGKILPTANQLSVIEARGIGVIHAGQQVETINFNSMPTLYALQHLK